MAIKVSWTDEAKETFSNNINYLLEAWTEKEVRNFVEQTELAIKKIQKFPESYPPGIKNDKYRRARLNKYIVLFYRFYKTKNEVVLITFWNVKQNPDKLQY
jgi:plasmid stabilization system protein ParE